MQWTVRPYATPPQTQLNRPSHWSQTALPRHGPPCLCPQYMCYLVDCSVKHLWPGLCPASVSVWSATEGPAWRWPPNVSPGWPAAAVATGALPLSSAVQAHPAASDRASARRKCPSVCPAPPYTEPAETGAGQSSQTLIDCVSKQG